MTTNQDGQPSLFLERHDFDLDAECQQIGVVYIQGCDNMSHLLPNDFP